MLDCFVTPISNQALPACRTHTLRVVSLAARVDLDAMCGTLLGVAFVGSTWRCGAARTIASSGGAVASLMHGWLSCFSGDSRDFVERDHGEVYEQASSRPGKPAGLRG